VNKWVETGATKNIVQGMMADALFSRFLQMRAVCRTWHEWAKEVHTQWYDLLVRRCSRRKRRITIPMYLQAMRCIYARQVSRDSVAVGVAERAAARSLGVYTAAVWRHKHTTDELEFSERGLAEIEEKIRKRKRVRNNLSNLDLRRNHG